MANAHALQPEAPRGLLTTIRYIMEAVKIQESLFALPFAYIGMILAAEGLPPFGTFFWATMAMVGIRNAGMAFNRVLDREVDGRNPRTATRHLPQGLLKPWELTSLGVIGMGLFFVSAAQLNPLALALSPVAAVLVAGYTFVKRFTWLTHFFIGTVLATAPTGGWVAVTGSLSWEVAILVLIVATFASGFDIFNTAADVEFDRANGIHSIPARFGVHTAFWVARALHVGTSAGLLALGLLLGLAWPYFIGWAIATGLLVYEHRVLKPSDLSKFGVVFSRINALVSISVLASIIVAVLMVG